MADYYEISVAIIEGVSELRQKRLDSSENISATPRVTIILASLCCLCYGVRLQDPSAAVTPITLPISAEWSVIANYQLFINTE
jgi:hypothetical protein